jgi:formylglycine-generating enzyme required for sulfatase activity
MVLVGDVGNSPDSNGYGAVEYAYRIGRTEVTANQYIAFLNAVAATDTYGLYNDEMGGAGGWLAAATIARTGSSGSYRYAAIDNGGYSGNRPIAHVSWSSAARFANWMSNGQPTGAQSGTTTENGAYDLSGPLIHQAINPNTGSAPLFSIPSENEWYKAAYYKGGGTNSGYWLYPTQSNSPPGNTVGSGTNEAWFGTGYHPGWNHLADVGSFPNSRSAYGTLDQGGNLLEWMDLAGESSLMRVIRGGSWEAAATDLSSAGRQEYYGGHTPSNIGFRLAGVVPVPEIDPSGAGIALTFFFSAVGIIERRRLGSRQAA